MIAKAIRAMRVYLSLLLFMAASQVIRQKARKADDGAQSKDHHDPVEKDGTAAFIGGRLCRDGLGCRRCGVGSIGSLGHAFFPCMNMR